MQHLWAKAKSDAGKRVILLIASGVFLLGLVVAYRNQPLDMDSLSLTPVLIVLLLAMPMTLLLNGVEFFFGVRLLGRAITLRDAMETTIIGAAANMLPLPGSAMVKVARMKGLGVDLRHGVSVTLLLAVIWLGVAFVYAGAWLVGEQEGYTVGMAALAGGTVLLLASGLFTLKLYGKPGMILRLLSVRILLVALDAGRLFLCLIALGMDGNFMQASVMAVSGVLGSAVSIVPAGLGVRELFAAAIGPVVGIAAAQAYLASALVRFLGLATILPAAFFLGLKADKKGTPNEG